MKPADPSRVTIEFHSDGTMLVEGIDGSGEPFRQVLKNAPVGSLLTVTANPGGLGLLDERGAHALTGQGAYFEMVISRRY